MPIRLRSAGVSDVGAFRDVNQDAAFTAPWGAAVADGVGGGPSGDLASAALIHRLVAGRVSVADAEALAVRIREAPGVAAALEAVGGGLEVATSGGHVTARLRLPARW